MGGLRPPLCMIALTILLGACSANYEVLPEVRQAEWEARNLYPQTYRVEIVAYLRTYLNDPTNIHDASISEPALKPMGLGNRFVSCVRYNAKKAGGGYAGVKDQLAVFVDGKLDSMRDGKDRCGDAAYGPFPELEKVAR